MLDLYMLDTCPYCKKVIDYMEENNIPCHKFNTLNAENSNRLIKLGGKEQVPFLHNEQTGEMMYESDDIIEYLKNFNQE